MRDEMLYRLEDCSQFRQTLLSRSPRVAHVTVASLCLLLAGAVVWAAWSRANLIVRAPGRVRPISTPTQIFSTASSQGSGMALGTRVAQVHVREGEAVRQGDTLLELDAEWLDAEIERQQEIIRTGEGELERLQGMVQLSADHFRASQAKQAAELAQARKQIDVAKLEQVSKVRLAAAEVDYAREQEAITREVGPKVETMKATLAVRQAEEKLAQAELPVQEEQVVVLRKALELSASEQALKQHELSIQIATKQGEIAAARKQLRKLEIDRKHTVLRAPFDGVITKGTFVVGDVVRSDRPAFEIAEQTGFLFEGAVRSEDVGLLAVGMPVRIKLDAFYYQKYGTLPGEVVFVSPDSLQPEPGEGVEPTIAYLVRVSLPEHEIGSGEARGQVKLGMAGVAEIVTGQESVLTLIFKRIRQSISLD